ncbi:MAG: hypothetical protein D6722_27295 [Bacteroidetes bacterium]|nr:MAG: hypothetical protein D6722_27295 [Bacteroidota bacterium]
MPHSYHIECLDLIQVASLPELQAQLQAILKNPAASGRDEEPLWESFSEQMPEFLILYEFPVFEQRFPEAASRFRRRIRDYNQQDRARRILLDSREGLPIGKPPAHLDCLFRRRPFQYGLRGDAPLWAALEDAFSYLPASRTEQAFHAQLLQRIEALTGGQALASGQDFFVEAFDHGGMSGGYVSADFWLSMGIPLLIGRYRQVHNH